MKEIPNFSNVAQSYLQDLSKVKTENSSKIQHFVIGARNETQLIENLGAVDWKLSAEHINKLDEVSKQKPMYPHWVGNR